MKKYLNICIIVNDLLMLFFLFKTLYNGFFFFFFLVIYTFTNYYDYYSFSSCHFKTTRALHGVHAREYKNNINQLKLGVGATRLKANKIGESDSFGIKCLKV